MSYFDEITKRYTLDWYARTPKYQKRKLSRLRRKILYRAFTDPAALADWLAPGGMTGEVHHFDESLKR